MATLVRKEHEGLSSFEIHFYEWLCVAKSHGYVESWEFEHETYIIAEKIMHQFGKKQLVILPRIRYTPDFRVVFTDKFMEEFKEELNVLKIMPMQDDENVILFDIKSKVRFNNESAREFNSKQRLLWWTLGIHVNRLTLDSKVNWFNQTFAPAPHCYKYGKKSKGFKKLFIDSKPLSEK